MLLEIYHRKIIHHEDIVVIFPINNTTISRKSNEIVSSYGDDFAFLLSPKDANQYFSSNADRAINSRWWLRLSTQTVARAGYVSSAGKVTAKAAGSTSAGEAISCTWSCSHFRVAPVQWMFPSKA